MAIVNILLNKPSIETLDDFAEALSAAGVGGDYVERESANYVDDRYFLSEPGSTKIIAAINDEEDHDDLPWWLTLSNPDQDEAGLAAMADALVEQRLLPAGFAAARIERFGRIDEVRHDYSLA